MLHRERDEHMNQRVHKMENNYARGAYVCVRSSAITSLDLLICLANVEPAFWFTEQWYFICHLSTTLTYSFDVLQGVIPIALTRSNWILHQYYQYAEPRQQNLELIDHVFSGRPYFLTEVFLIEKNFQKKIYFVLWHLNSLDFNLRIISKFNSAENGWQLWSYKIVCRPLLISDSTISTSKLPRHSVVRW